MLSARMEYLKNNWKLETETEIEVKQLSKARSKASHTSVPMVKAELEVMEQC